MYRLLQLQHRRHTGKLLRHHHTSYRMLALLLALTGGLLVWTTGALYGTSGAEQLFVHATVPAPVPTTAAVILEPKDGTTTTEATTTVSGTCPVITPAVAVAIYDNGSLAGSAPCLADGTFQVQITLTLGENTLIAKTITITDRQGPDSAAVTVTYAPASSSPTPLPPTPSGPPVVTPPAGPSGGNAANPAPIVIASDRPFVVFGPRQAAAWTGAITGGTPPYTITLNWGDGSIVSLQNVGAGRQTFQHTFTKMVAYVLRITVIDQHAGSAIASFAVMTPYVAPSAPLAFGTPVGGGFVIYKYVALYSLYLAAVCSFGVAWLRTHPYAYAHVPAGKRAPAVRKRRRR